MYYIFATSCFNLGLSIQKHIIFLEQSVHIVIGTILSPLSRQISFGAF